MFGSEEASEIASKRYQAAWNAQCPGQVWTAVGSLAAEVKRSRAFCRLTQTDDERQTTDDCDKHWEPLFRVRFGGVPAHDRLASGVCRTLGPRLEVQTDIQTDERNTLYQTQFYLQPAHHWVPQASLLGAPGFPESPLRINVYVNISNMSVLLCFNNCVQKL